MSNSLPYKICYSENKEICKKCNTNIKAGRVQMAIMKQSDDDDCYYPEWYHMKCFFTVCLPRTEAAFDGFVRLRYTDQRTIQLLLGTLEVDPELENESPALPDFYIEYAKVDRDSCTVCRDKIKLNELRIMNVVHDNDHNTAFDGTAKWYHVICFACKRIELGWMQAAEVMPGFTRLKDFDKERIKKQIPLISLQLNKPTESRTNPNQVDLESLIERQNKEYYEIYDKLVHYISNSDQTVILNANVQHVPEQRIDRLHQLTDVLYYGALSLCKSCETGQLVFKNSAYVCTNVTSWSKCGNVVKEPKRHIPKILPKILNKYPWLKRDYTNPSKRLLHSFRLIDEHGNDLVYGPYKHPPLFNMEFTLIGKLTKSSQTIERMIKKMGGKVVSIIHDKLAAVISTPDEVKKKRLPMKVAKKCNIQVISEDFLEAIETTDPILYIISESLAQWGGDPFSRIEQSELVIRKDEDYYTKSLPKKVTYKLKGGCAIDPECGLEDNAHVFSRDFNGRDVKYTAIMILVDIENDKNSYFRMQLLKSNTQPLYWIFESWGRISTVIGSKRLKMYGSEHEAVETFETIFQEKTGNKFGNIRFYKRPNKFYQVDTEIGPTQEVLNSVIPSKLSLPLFELMRMLFDLQQLENMMLSCDLDLKQMPLGKISGKQIRFAMTVLRDISKLITRNEKIGKLRDASNKFYTLIPHGFGVNRPPLIDSLEVVRTKNEMLESLLNMELIYEYLDGGNGIAHPLDDCYNKLNNRIVPVATNSPEFQHLAKIVRETHGATHNYTLEILEMFKVYRNEEDTRFHAYTDVSNHQLLWHGSRLMNFVNILSNGLKIAPPEAPATGYMFGKGIYFADVVTKAANYCFTTRQNNVGLMLLCEVALGNTRDLYFADNTVSDIPNEDTYSVRGCGSTFPTLYSLVDNVYMASGGLIRAQMRTSLIYNEFIVYNPAQVQIKYLFKMKFHYK